MDKSATRVIYWAAAVFGAAAALILAFFMVISN